MQCGKVLLRISGKLSDQIFGTRIRLDRKYGARPAGRIPIPIGSISLEPDPYQIIRIRINYNKKAPISLEKNSLSGPINLLLRVVVAVFIKTSLLILSSLITKLFCICLTASLRAILNPVITVVG